MSTTNGNGQTRRTQEERSAATREKVILAAVDCIAEEGLHRATTTRIARRAGVTWGAIQHQFGDKHSIYVAVMERALEDLCAEIDRLPDEFPGLRERIRAFTHRTWAVFDRPFYRAFLEITLGSRARRENPPAPGLADRALELIFRSWSELLQDVEISPERKFVAQRIAFTTLNGMAVVRTLRPQAPAFHPELEVLDDTLYRLLSG